MNVYDMLPPEMRAQLEAQHLEARSKIRDIERFIHGLGKEDLITLDDILDRARLDDSGQIASNMQGRIDALLKEKFNVCRCGQNHDDDLAAPDSPADLDKQTDAPAGHTQEELPFAEADRASLMTQFNVVEGADGKLSCGGCGIHIASLEDRMVKPPGSENCSGCVQKAKWG